MYMALNQNSEFKLLFIIRQRPDNNTEKSIYSQLSKFFLLKKAPSLGYTLQLSEWGVFVVES